MDYESIFAYDLNHQLALLAFHSPFFASENYVEKQNMTLYEFTFFLRVAHGVRSVILYVYLSDCFPFAKKYQLPNVIQLLEQRLIFERHFISFKTIFAYDLNHYLAFKLRGLKSLEELTSILKLIGIQDMSGEAMKQCVKFFIEH
uniref:BTB domain-containing protein n=1 Tax=Caenorhabditis tropicalis TaxID=1561998 RepID=A0A1I7UKR7_9PELO